MADWKMPLGYNYNPSYHAYAYGLMYQTGPEQNNTNMPGWVDGAYNPAITGSYYTNTGSQQESPPCSPEQTVANNHAHLRGSSVGSFGESHKQTGRLYLSHNWLPCDGRAKKNENASSDTPSDSEAHTSPDSWSSRERDATQVKPVNCLLKDPDDEIDVENPEGSHVSSSLPEEPSTGALGSENTHLSVPPPKAATVTSKAKARTAFSESQMNTLTQRFNMQRYLTPVEMKTLAGLTGLTYKQVKTWFQNRRMKLRRHQKDDHWVSERFPTNNPKGCSSSVSPHISTFQREAQSLNQEHYNQQMRESSFRQSPPHNLSFYNAAGTNYPLRPSSPRSTARSQATSWPLPPPVNHYEYNPNTFSTATVIGNASSIDRNSFHSPLCMATMPTGNQ